MDFGLKGKVAIVTGASRGIGRATALTLAKEGAHVVVAGIDEYCYYNVSTRGKNLKIEELESLSREIQSLGVQSIAVKTDVSNRKDVQNLVEKTMNRFGRIDICVNNAGTSMPEDLNDASEENWNLHIDVCLTGTYYVCTAVLPIMKKQHWGRIINLSSYGALAPYPYLATYQAAKAGVTGLTRSLVMEYARYGVTTNCVLPGPTDTPMARTLPTLMGKLMNVTPEQYCVREDGKIPTGRMNKPEDIANAICFLASEQATQITGISLLVAGGAIMN